MNVDDLQPGNDMDRAVFEVMALRSVPGMAVPPFSTSIADAWMVVEYLRAEGWLVIIKTIPDGAPFWLTNDPVAEPNAMLYKRAVCDLFDVKRQWPDLYLPGRNYGDGAPEAICRALLNLAEERKRREVPA